jgi:lipid A 3-O-deacylase
LSAGVHAAAADSNQASPEVADSATTFGDRESGPGIGTWNGAWAGWLSELRFGVLAHNIGPIASAREDGAQLNAELRVASPGVFEYILSPRPHIGASINTAGDTSFLYFGLTWTWNIYRGLFADFSLGGTVHNGWLNSDDPNPEQRLLGSRLLFREALELGYRFWDHHSVSIMLDHASNAGLADKNQGNDDIGVRYGYHF